MTRTTATQRCIVGGGPAPRPPPTIRLVTGIPLLRRIPARLLGIGARPEHARSPDAHR
jgi:hypothetical protein